MSTTDCTSRKSAALIARLEEQDGAAVVKAKARSHIVVAHTKRRAPLLQKAIKLALLYKCKIFRICMQPWISGIALRTFLRAMLCRERFSITRLASTVPTYSSAMNHSQKTLRDEGIALRNVSIPYRTKMWIRAKHCQVKFELSSDAYILTWTACALHFVWSALHRDRGKQDMQQTGTWSCSVHKLSAQPRDPVA